MSTPFIYRLVRFISGPKDRSTGFLTRGPLSFHDPSPFSTLFVGIFQQILEDLNGDPICAYLEWDLLYLSDSLDLMFYLVTGPESDQ